MQAFIKRADLLADDGSAMVPILALYGNGMVMAIDAHGSMATLIFLQDDLGLVFHDRDKSMDFLITSWRDNYKPVINWESNRRIVKAFPEYKQRNYTARYQDNITKYGTDPSQWPQAEKDWTVEYDRGWQYVSDVRSTSNAFTALPADPTADEHWPPAITPVQ